MIPLASGTLTSGPLGRCGLCANVRSPEARRQVSRAKLAFDSLPLSQRGDDATPALPPEAAKNFFKTSEVYETSEV